MNEAPTPNADGLQRLRLFFSAGPVDLGQRYALYLLFPDDTTAPVGWTDENPVAQIVESHWRTALQAHEQRLPFVFGIDRRLRIPLDTRALSAKTFETRWRQMTLRQKWASFPRAIKVRIVVGSVLMTMVWLLVFDVLSSWLRIK